MTYGTGSNAITKDLAYSYDAESRLATITYPDGSLFSYDYDKANLQKAKLANGQAIEWSQYQWMMPTEINFPGVKKLQQYDALLRPLNINVMGQNGSTLMERSYQYNTAGNITQRQTEKGSVGYQYDLLDRLTEAKPDSVLQGLGLPDEAYTYDAIGNRLGSRHQQGEFKYNPKDQLTQ